MAGPGRIVWRNWVARHAAWLVFGLLAFLLLLTVGGSALLLAQFRDVRCYRITPPYTYGERAILNGELLDCAVVNCRVTVGLGSEQFLSCYFRLASQPLPIFPDEGSVFPETPQGRGDP